GKGTKRSAGAHPATAGYSEIGVLWSTPAARILMKLAILALLISAFACHSNAQTASTAPAPPSGLVASRVTGTIDPQKAADIRHLLEVTGTGGLSVQMMRAMEADIRPVMEKSLPPGEYRARLIGLYFAKFESKASVASLTELEVPVYDRHFSDDEIKQLIAF